MDSFEEILSDKIPVVKKGTKNIIEIPNYGTVELTNKQKKFCEYFTLGDKDGNGKDNATVSYGLAYGIDLGVKSQYVTAGVEGHKNLKKPNLLAYCRFLLNHFLNDFLVDNELAYLVLQRADLSTKLGAIKEYNKIKGRLDDMAKKNSKNNDSVLDDSEYVFLDKDGNVIKD